MKISLDETITLEFNTFALTRAGEHIAAIKKTHEANPETADNVLNGILTILLFRQIEKTVPGTLNRFTQACRETQDNAKE